jgi:hypothetical protein
MLIINNLQAILHVHYFVGDVAVNSPYRKAV